MASVDRPFEINWMNPLSKVSKDWKVEFFFNGETKNPAISLTCLANHYTKLSGVCQRGEKMVALLIYYSSLSHFYVILGCDLY